MIKYICNKCGRHMTLKTMYKKSLCLRCNNKYMAEYREKNRDKINEYNAEWSKTKRWLNGYDNVDDIGDIINVGLRSINGQLKINI